MHEKDSLDRIQKCEVKYLNVRPSGNIPDHSRSPPFRVNAGRAGMRRSVEVQPAMPWQRLWLYVVLLAISVAIFGFLIISGLINSSVKLDIAVGVMLTLFILSATELIPEIARRYALRLPAGQFRLFFGEAALNHNIHFVCVYRKLDPNLQVDPWSTPPHVPVTEGKPVAEGATNWHSAQDIRATIYLSSTLAKYTDQKVRVTYDRNMEGDDFQHCTISLGLGFNRFTNRLAKWCDDKLFEVRWGHSPKANFAPLTDFFAVGDGTVPEPPTDKDDCIVARIVPWTEAGQSQRVCFVCAGRTAAGTAAAGYFLAHRWQELLQLYREHSKDLSADSLVVVVRHTAIPSGGQEYDASGEIAKDKADKRLIRWWRIPAHRVGKAGQVS